MGGKAGATQEAGVEVAAPAPGGTSPRLPEIETQQLSAVGNTKNLETAS